MYGFTEMYGIVRIFIKVLKKCSDCTDFYFWCTENPYILFKINKIVILAICHTVVTKVLECVIISVMVLMN